ncbi:hypothetical protein [Polynucleobacter sp. UK-Kesae-W10]|uniref:hypothetical protein n=1 Tax=Polynucleobacter sp. UK-Kesae-W10 TaxID=1819738 RepID=UPI002101EF76|nr:hypothetical protein [Polynucleobacter sp. UK-Kesae-W10]
MLRIIFFIVCIGSLGACSVIPDKNQDPAKNNVATYRKDFKECREDYPEQQGSGVHIRQWEGCMNLKGWK